MSPYQPWDIVELRTTQADSEANELLAAGWRRRLLAVTSGDYPTYSLGRSNYPARGATDAPAEAAS